MQEKVKSTGKRQKKNWFQTVRPTLVKQTVAVTVITVILAVMISIMDSAILEGINLLIR